MGIATARLPIGEYITMTHRKVLTVNHVFEIMMNYLRDKDWRQAFLSIIPERKLVDKKKDDDANETSN